MDTVEPDYISGAFKFSDIYQVIKIAS